MHAVGVPHAHPEPTTHNSGSGAAPASTISSFDYTYDDHDRRTRVDLADGGYWDYTYAAAGQLTGGTRFGPKLDNTEGTLVQYAYQYDNMGQPSSRGLLAQAGRSGRCEAA